MTDRIKIAAAVAGLFLSSMPKVFGEEPEVRIPVIVELFTSEGCSSCPPADRLLANLLEKQPIQNIEIIGLEQHVDYWDRLGWRDPFSSKQFTARQSSYGGVFNLRSIYTPQMVVDGTHQFVGSERGDALNAIAAAAKQPKALIDLDLSLSPSSTQEKRLAVQADVKEVPGDLHVGRLNLILAILEDDLASNVIRGENRGKRLQHQGVTRHFETIGSMTPESSTSSHQATVSLDESWRLPNLKAVVFLQDSQSGRIIGATSRPVPAP